MIISRILVEEGFLNGLDLRLSHGLNVLIGARGTGKTSVIELIRYALGARNSTPDSKKRSLDHARSILEGGEVTVTLSGLLQDIVVSRGADDETPRASGQFTTPVVLSQTEIETIGLSDPARLSLLDGFVPGRGQLRADEAAAISAIRSAFKELETLETEIRSLNDGLDQLDALKAQHEALKQQQLALQGGSQQVAEKQAKLAAIATESASLAAQETTLERFEGTSTKWNENLGQLLSDDFGLERGDGPPTEDPLADLRTNYETALAQVQKASEAFDRLSGNAKERIAKLTARRQVIDSHARLIR